MQTIIAETELVSLQNKHIAGMNSGVQLSVVMPVFNEAPIIEASLKNKLAWLQQKNFIAELILVNDASTDDSEVKILTLQNNLPLVYLKNECNLGFGGTVRKGIAAAQGEKILCLPADLFITAEKANEIIALLNSNDVVACYRESKPGNSFVSIVGSIVYQGLIKMIYRVKVRDLNWVHAYRKSIFTEHGIKPESNRIFFLAEVLILANRKKLSIAELELPQQKRQDKKGTSQSFVTFVKAMSDLVVFMFR